MATKKKTEQAAPVQERTAAAAAEEMRTAGAPEENGHGERTTADRAPELESLSTLADRHRAAPWHQAALRRLMGWADGKMASDAEYREALDALRCRPLGGGRRR